MSIKRIIATVTREDGGVVHEFELGGFPSFLYQPANKVSSNLINYGFTGPMLAVFSDRRLSREEAVEFAEKQGFAGIASRNGVGVVIVCPKGDTWSGEQPGAYEALADNLAIAQSNFRDGLAIMYDDAVPDRVEYCILGSCVRMYVYGIGSGADYLAENCLRTIEGTAVLGDLGKADLTPVCCTLVKGTKMPKPEKNDIHVVSVGNSEEYNDILRKFCSDVLDEETVDYARDFESSVGKYRRWAGKIDRAYDYASMGIAEVAESVMLPVSEDNTAFKRGPFNQVTEHKTGYVTFYDKDLDMTGDKVPLVLVFHGGGDSAYATATLAQWPEIGKSEGFITVAVEMHLKVTAREVSALIDHLLEEYPIDSEKIYATGFSMGGIKSWDLFEQCPDRFAALMPMNAIDYVGNNCQFGKTATVNRDTLVPLFYIGGVDSFGVELPCHHERAIERIQYLSDVNRFKNPYRASMEEKDSWADPLYAVKGDRVEVLHDDMFPDSVYTVHYFDSLDGNCYTALMGVTHHAHEIRPFTNRFAWNFVKKFRRTAEGIKQEG